MVRATSKKFRRVTSEARGTKYRALDKSINNGQARKRELLIQEVRIEDDSDQKFFKVFLKITFFRDLCYSVHYLLLAENIFLIR